MTVHTAQANNFSTLPDSAYAPMMGDTMLENRFAVSGPILALYKANPDLMQKQAARRSRWLAVLAYVKQHGITGTVLCADRDCWAVITPDVQAGFYRYSCFDAKGFFAHGTFQTAAQALIAAFDMGYRQVERPEILDEMALNQW